MKKCNNCHIYKDLSEFHKNRGTCKECRKIKSQKYMSKPEVKSRRSKKQKQLYNENIDHYREYYRGYFHKNSKKHSEVMKEYHSRSYVVKKRAEYSRKYYIENEAKLKEKSARRRTSIKQATLSGFDKELLDIYKNCPKGWHVDHIIPLNGENFTGLHVPWNLQYLPAKENLSKSNKLDINKIRANCKL